MKNRIISFFKSRHVRHYRCELKYYTMDGFGSHRQLRERFSNVFQFSIKSDSNELKFNDREIKQILAPGFLKKAHKDSLSNGQIKVMNVQYLGMIKVPFFEKGGNKS